MSRAAVTTLAASLVCLACGSQQTTSCAAGEHNGGNGVCVVVGTCSAGFHDGGDGKCSATGTCSTGYRPDFDGACVRGSSCPSGTHDNGAGVCVATISCPSGYHDGGSGTCVPTGSCSSGYHDGGNGECWVLGTCGSGFHDGGNGTCVPLVACSTSYHDGGDGRCVHDGSCSYGFHDGGDGRCVTPEKCSAGYHDGGGSTCIPYSGCLGDYRDDGTGGCVCRPSPSLGITQAMCPCAKSFHDDGTGRCIASGCATGYHDGGDGNCTTVTACSAGYYNDGMGLCLQLPAACSATSCGGTPLPCAAGYHDGGNGRCVALGSCATGFYEDGSGACVQRADAGGLAAGGSGGVRDAAGVGGGGASGGGGFIGTGGAGASTTARDAGQDSGLPDTISARTDGPRGGTAGFGGTSGSGGATSLCGNGKVDPGEGCDCGNNASQLPIGCLAVNGINYSDGTGCTKTCTKEALCMDANGKTQPCAEICGDGTLGVLERCDDGNLLDGDGCSHDCTIEEGFTCTTTTVLASQTCQSGAGQCIELPIVYRDFQPENVEMGGHPDFYFLGSQWNYSLSPTTICVPNAAGPAKGNDFTSRCWGIVADTLLHGKPQLGTTTTCACQFSDWNVGNSSRISGGYTEAGNDSPLSDRNGGFLGRTAGTAVNTTSASGASTGTLTGYTPSTLGGPIWKGTVPIVKDANSLRQWYSDDASVNKTFIAVLELQSIGSNIYQYASRAHLGEGGFFPLDTLNPAQKTLCNLWPYWNHGDGRPIWSTCRGDQYLFTPRAMPSDCASGDTLDDGCWVPSVSGQTHNYFFTSEARTHFVYDGASGLRVSAYADDDLFIFINGQLVLDLGGTHFTLPGLVTVTGNPGSAQVVEGGCLDTTGNVIGTTAGSKDCSPKNQTAPGATSGADFRVRTVSLGLETGKTYELAIFHAKRMPVESNFQITLQGFSAKRSNCQPN